MTYQNRVISFISGKGGVGKTAISSSVGYILKELGYKVLLIDSDLYSHGLTFLLSDSISNMDVEKSGLIETIIDDKKDLDVLSGKHSINYIASTTNPRTLTSSIVSEDVESSSNVTKDKINNIKAKHIWDYILIDTQAGPEDITKAIVSISDTVIIISESDAISQFTNFNLIGELHEHLPQNRTYRVINKLQYEQIEYKKAIDEMLGQLAYLPSIPFDFSVIRSYLVGDIPVNFDEPSSYLHGIINFTGDLFPEIKDDLNKYLLKKSGKLLQPLEERKRDILADIAKLNNDIEYINAKLSYTKRSMSKTTFLRNIFPIIALFIMVITVVIERYVITRTEYFLALTAITVLIFGYSYIRLSGSRKELETEEEREELNRKLTHANRVILVSYNELSNINSLIIERSYEPVLSVSAVPPEPKLSFERKDVVHWYEEDNNQSGIIADMFIINRGSKTTTIREVDIINMVPDHLEFKGFIRTKPFELPIGKDTKFHFTFFFKGDHLRHDEIELDLEFTHTEGIEIVHAVSKLMIGLNKTHERKPKPEGPVSSISIIRGSPTRILNQRIEADRNIVEILKILNERPRHVEKINGPELLSILKDVTGDNTLQSYHVKDAIPILREEKFANTFASIGENEYGFDQVWITPSGRNYLKMRGLRA